MNKINLIILLCFLINALPAQETGSRRTYTHQELQDSLSAAFTAHDNKRIANAYFELSRYSQEIALDKRKAMEYLNNSFYHYKLVKDSASIIRGKERFAEILEAAELHENALIFLEEALNYYQRRNRQKQVMRIMERISSVYEGMGEYEKQGAYIKKASEINEILKDSLMSLMLLIDKTNYYQHYRQYDSAMASAHQSLELSRVLRDTPFLSLSQFHLGLIHQSKGNYDEAVTFLLESEKYTFPKKNNRQISQIYRQLAQCYARQQDFENAYLYNQRYARLNDSILIQEREDALDKLTMQYEVKQKQSTIEALEEEKLRAEGRAESQKTVMTALTFSLVALIVALILVMWFYRHRMRTSEILSLQSEEINRQKIKELENSLNIETMHSMMSGQEKERERIAKDLHDSLGGMLSTAKLQLEKMRAMSGDNLTSREIAKTQNLLDDTIKEVRNISRDLQPDALLRFGLVAAVNDLVNRTKDRREPMVYFQHFGLENHLPQGVSLHIYRIIQELLNNTLKHALSREVLIQITRNEHELIVLVEDDGIGFDPMNASKGMGMGNIQSRVHFLKGEVSVQTGSGEGTTTVITIPVS